LGTEVDEGGLASAVKSLLADPARRRAMSARGRALVDGFGAARAAEVVLDRGRTRLPEGQEAPRGRPSSRAGRAAWAATWRTRSSRAGTPSTYSTTSPPAPSRTSSTSRPTAA